MRFRSWFLSAAASAVFVGIGAPRALALDNADSVVSYTSGDFTVTSTSSSYDNPSAALGPLAGDTGYGYGLDPFDPPYDPSQIVALGAGGSLELHMAAPVATTGHTLGVFSANGIVNTAVSAEAQATSPATTFDQPDPGLPEAEVSVSKDGNTWVNLNGGNPITFGNPSNYYLDSDVTADSNGYISQSLGSVLADQSKPFLGSLSSFDGETYTQMLATLNGSAGGNWLDLSGTGLSQVNYVEFSVPSGADYRFFADSLSAVPVPEPTMMLPIAIIGLLSGRRPRRQP